MIFKHNYLQNKRPVNKSLTLELMRQELEALKEAQSGPNPMDISLTDKVDLNRERDKAEQEKRKLAEELEKIAP